jgi:hypothetical protein
MQSMKAKNEDDFTIVRIKRSTMYKIKELNAKEMRLNNKHVTLHQTIEKIVCDSFLRLSK